jgi:protein-S-isoprenylcysteine O-methyltransferase Ste14
MLRGSGQLLLALAETIAWQVIVGVVLFASAGAVHAPCLRTYLIVTSGMYLPAVVLIYVASPDLLLERMKPGAGERDRLSIAALMAILLVHYVVAGLDAGRFHWSRGFPGWIVTLGLLALIFGFLISLWAMLLNRFFSSAVRLQEDRGQTVVTSGPYRVIRHPGYTGGLLFLLGSGAALGSWVAILPMLFGIPILVRRIRIEELMLLEGLPGYREYAHRVRYRLVPGIW